MFEEMSQLVAMISAGMFLVGLVSLVIFWFKYNVDLGSNNIRAMGIVFLIPAILLAGALGGDNRSEIFTLLGTFGGYILARSAKSSTHNPRGGEES